MDDAWIREYLLNDHAVYDKIKRAIDITIGSLLLTALFPVSFLVALCNKLGSHGRIFYVQKRVGYGKEEFTLLKFRTMVHDAEKDGPRFASSNDSRITRVGRFMRMFRIDEVPQLINIIRGEMSLVGPRPERPEFFGKLEKEIPLFGIRAEARPGLTGWAQVHCSYAGDIIDHHKEKLECDLYYLESRNLFLDVKILLKTVWIVLSKKGTR